MFNEINTNRTRAFNIINVQTLVVSFILVSRRHLENKSPSVVLIKTLSSPFADSQVSWIKIGLGIFVFSKKYNKQKYNRYSVRRVLCLAINTIKSYVTA